MALFSFCVGCKVPQQFGEKDNEMLKQIYEFAKKF